MIHHICKTCGGTLINENSAWSCKYCGNVYEDDSVRKDEETLRSLLDEMKTEQVANLRRGLYDAVNAKYIDSEEIIRICSEIKKLLPDDFMANFYYIANHGTSGEICEAIRNIDELENAVHVEGVIKHILSSMRFEYALPLQNLVERAYKGKDIKKFESLSTEISKEAEKVKAGIYETAAPRDVFVAYSSKDMKEVERLVEYLEANSLDCFVAARNLRHGRGAVQNYEAAICEAIENCKCVVFVSSVNSRNMECDALTVELKQIKKRDIEGAPAEYRKNYAAMPLSYKMNRVEYRLDDKDSQPYAKKLVSEFFSGLEYACSPEEVVDRIYSFEDAPSIAAIPPAKAQKEPAHEHRDTEKKENTYEKSVRTSRSGGHGAVIAICVCVAVVLSLFAYKYILGRGGEDTPTNEELTTPHAQGTTSANGTENTSATSGNATSGNATTEVSPNASTGLNCQFDRNNGTCTVLGIGSCADTDIIIGEYIDGCKVTTIAGLAFNNCKDIYSVTIPDTVTEIGNSAFSNCENLREVAIPKTGLKTLGDSVFKGCSSLREITLPVSVTSIGKYVFQDCTSLSKITIRSKSSNLSDGFFMNCSSLTEVTLSPMTKTVGKAAFYGCSSLTSVSLPEITTIEANAFEKSGITEIAFSGSKDAWSKMTKETGWNKGLTSITVNCTDGVIIER